jgi:hypothetical protein
MGKSTKVYTIDFAFCSGEFQYIIRFCHASLDTPGGGPWEGSFSHNPIRCDLLYLKATHIASLSPGIDSAFPTYSNSTSQSNLGSAKFWGFWFLIRTMETSMYFAHSLQIEYSNQVLFLQPPVTNPFGLTSTNWGFLPSDLHCRISRSNACLLDRAAFYMWVVWTVLGDAVSAPLLAPRLREAMLPYEAQLVE